MISIVINNYNYGRFLTECIESGLNQSAAFEIIVVDDGSTDDSPERIRAFGDRIVPVFEANAGQAAAMNAGFSVSRGDWILFLDADDYLLPGALGRLETELKEPFTKFQFPLERRDGSNRRLGLIPPDLEELMTGNALQLFRKTGMLSTPPNSGNVFSRKWLNSIMPVPAQEFRLCADLYLSLSALVTQEIKTLREPIGVYRVHSENKFYQEIVFSLTPERAPGRLAAMRQMIELLQRQQVADDIDSVEAYADRFLNLRQLKEMLLAARLVDAGDDFLMGRVATHRAIARRIDAINRPTTRWLERLNVFLIRFAPLFVLPMFARAECIRKRSRHVASS